MTETYRPSKNGSRDPRLVAALTASKLAGGLIRRLGRGGGTAAPGLVAEQLDPKLLAKLTAQLPHGAVIVAGTNGKTTTTRMIADVFEVVPWKVVHNRSGSNLVRGVTAAFVQSASVTGRIGGDVGVIEADEAALPELIRRVQPRFVLLNNLFRDQLDRYGELDTIAKTWRGVLRELPATTTVIVNGDDPTLVAISDDIPARRVCFGLDERTHLLDALPHAADAAICRVCGADLGYNALYVSHLGDWYCTGCDRKRPQLQYTGSEIELHGVTSLAMRITGEPGDAFDMQVGVPGLYNAYNALAAAAVARESGVPWEMIAKAFAAFRSAFGRIERVSCKGRELTLALVKNPTGFNEVLRMLTAETGGLQLPTMIAINDLDADGRDVSWLWDVDFELLAEGEGDLYTTGLRGPDMANRLKYAGVATSRIHMLPNDVTAAFDAFVDALPEGAGAYILPTYTAMLALRKTLADRGIVTAFWEQ
jgi:lipid II isoglutaminyl synthase (glutamine-hydrolysing)